MFQQLVMWMSSGLHGERCSRQYLEKNRNLIEDDTEKELERLISAHAEETPEMKEKMDKHRMLLQETRKRGGTIQAIREAYVNLYGGFALDLPPWLESFQIQWEGLQQLHRPERTRRRIISILREALAQAQRECHTDPAIIAELHNQLGQLLVQGPQMVTQLAQIKALEEAILHHQQASNIYTMARYPLQYAKTQIYLGQAYLQYANGGPCTIGQRAIESFQEALKIYTFDLFPEQWLQTYTYLGSAYILTQVGDRNDNIETGIMYQKKALEHITEQTPRTLQAMIFLHLGDAYRVRTIGKRKENHSAARNYYYAALRIFTKTEHPYEWGLLHSRLAALKEEYPERNHEKRDKNLQYALVCYEEALSVYTPDTYLVEHAAVLRHIADIHFLRPRGDRISNLEQAALHYRRALSVFTSNTFPADYRQTLLKLAETSRMKQNLIKQQGEAQALSSSEISKDCG
ncbi:hypothetical protein [Thermosporothrix hazakensis]|uniref:hypothetical protein n=1 Tax=Thermosporothrix hazakensis TaxID=644383 RepID=UPI001B87FA18|nr:hypothetical protein [Thermosporothrix hazakensis]